MTRFVSEPIRPTGGTISTADLARAEPSLPEGFVWREKERRVVEVLGKAKGYKIDLGDKYVGRHTWRLRMDDGSIWNVYFARQPPKRGRGGRADSPRWFLKTIED